MQGSRQGENTYLSSRNVHALFGQLAQRLGLNTSDPSVQNRYKQILFESVNSLHAKNGNKLSLAEFNRTCLDTCIRDINQRRQQIPAQRQQAQAIPGGRRMGETAAADAHRRREQQSAASRGPIAPPHRPKMAGLQDGFAPSGQSSGGSGGGAPLISSIQGNRPYITATGEMGSEMYMGPVDDDNLDQKTIDALTRGRPTGTQAVMDYTVGPNGRPIQKMNFSLVQGKHQGASGGGASEYNPSTAYPGAGMQGAMPGGMGMPPNMGGAFDPNYNFDAAMGGDPFASFGMAGQQLIGSGASGGGMGGGMGGGNEAQQSKKMSDIDNRMNRIMLDRANMDAETDQPLDATRANMGMGAQGGDSRSPPRQAGGVNPTTMNPLQLMQQQMGNMAQFGSQHGINQQQQMGNPNMFNQMPIQDQMQGTTYPQMMGTMPPNQGQAFQGQFPQPPFPQVGNMQLQQDPSFFLNNPEIGNNALASGQLSVKDREHLDAMRLMKKKFTKMAISLKKREKSVQIKLLELNKRELQEEARKARSSLEIGNGSSKNSPEPESIEFEVDCKKVTEPRFYSNYAYQFTKPQRGIKAMYLTEYHINRGNPKTVLETTNIRFEHNNSQWTTAVVKAGEYTEESFLQELEAQMGSDVYRLGRDERSGNIFVRRVDDRKFRIDTMNNIMNSLGFESIEREEATMFIAENLSTFATLGWYLYVEDQNMGPLDNRTEPIPIIFSEPEDISVLKIKICDKDGKEVNVNGCSHKLSFEMTV